ncbi:MAG: flagella basal body P-ring formation protein FlgA [Polyangiales bacterium]
MRITQSWLAALAVVASEALVSGAPHARAEEIAVESERVTLAMILPALAGTELGALDVAPAPLPGERTLVKSAEIRAKIKQSGHDTRGLAIPRSVRLVRRSRDLGSKQLDEMIRTALAPQVAPCDVTQVSDVGAVTVGEGEIAVEADPMPRKQSGRASATITLRQGDRTQRLSVQTQLSCPAPVMVPGASIRIVAISGAVRVTAPGVANQPGRVGDEIRVTNSLTKRALKARVIDASSAEVVQ